MNELAHSYWQIVQNELQLTGDMFVRAYRFADTPDELAELVVLGQKTATSNTKKFFEKTSRHIPQAGDYNIILNRKYEPVCAIQIETVEIKRYCDVDEQFALMEGDGSYKNWDEIHTRYFTNQYKQFADGESFHREILLICQTFRLIHVNRNNQK